MDREFLDSSGVVGAAKAEVKRVERDLFELKSKNLSKDSSIRFDKFPDNTFRGNNYIRVTIPSIVCKFNQNGLQTDSVIVPRRIKVTKKSLRMLVKWLEKNI